MTFSTNATCSRARISAFLITTCFTQNAIGINRTFWTASWWRSDIPSYTGTHTLLIYFLTNTVWTTWWRRTWILYHWFLKYYLVTCNKCISSHSRWTMAHWYMIINFTNCIISTSAYTWIDTFIFHTGFIFSTIFIQNTFRATSTVGITLITEYTWTNSIITCSTWSTWRRITWICVLWLWS